MTKTENKKIHKAVAEHDYRLCLEVLDRNVNRIIRDISNVDSIRRDVGEMKKVLSIALKDLGYQYGVKDKR